MRTLFIKRPVRNGHQIVDWAKASGIPTTLPQSELHVTQYLCKEPVDWSLIPFAEVTTGIRISGGQRSVERLGPAIVLKFYSPSLTRRFNELKTAGIPFFYTEYTSHVSLSYQNQDFDISALKPYDGDIVLGEEVIMQVDENYGPKES